MSPEKWENLKSRLEAAFPDLEFEVEELPPEKQGKKEVVRFSGPLGLMKLEFVSQPKVLDKKTIGSKRIGSRPKVEYLYSPDEFSYFLKAYRWDHDRQNWEEINFKESFNF